MQRLEKAVAWMSERWRRVPVLGYLTARHLAWLHFKVAGILWAVLYGLYTPVATVNALAWPIRLSWLTVCIAGAVVGIVGLVMGAQPGERARKRGPQVELIGLIALAIGPGIYFTTQLGLVVQEGSPTRIGAAFLGYFVVAGVLARAAAVIPRFRRELHDMVPKRGNEQ